MGLMIGFVLVGLVSLWLAWKIERLDKRLLEAEARLASLRDDLERGLTATFEELP